MLSYKKLGITGNRLHKLPKSSIPLVKKRIEVAVREFARKGGVDLYHGVALGVDQWAASEGFKNYLDIHSYVPFKGQEKNWTEEQRLKYHDLLYKSTTVEYFGDYPKANFFFNRNRKIVEMCDILFSVHVPGETRGGAFYTTNYALKMNKPVLEVIVHPGRLENKFHVEKLSSK